MTSPVQDYAPRAYREGDEHEILRLFAIAFGQPRSIDHWRWKYLDNPWGDRRISLTFSPDGQLLAHYAGYPVPWFDARPGGRGALLSLQVGDTMTAAGFRHIGRGPTSLLGRTLRHFYDTFCAGHVAFNYGVNTANIQRFSLLFANAHRSEDVAYWVLPQPPRPARSRRWPLGRYEVEPVESVGGEWDELFARVSGAYGLLVRRDQAYVRWRYLAAPDGGLRLWAIRTRWGRLVGWGAFRRSGTDLVWGDALVEPGHAESMHSLLAAAASEPEPDPDRPALERVTAWFPRRPTWWLETIRSLGFQAEPQPQQLALMCVPFVASDAPELLAQAYWTQGDSDLF